MNNLNILNESFNSLFTSLEGTIQESFDPQTALKDVDKEPIEEAVNHENDADNEVIFNAMKSRTYARKNADKLRAMGITPDLDSYGQGTTLIGSNGKKLYPGEHRGEYGGPTRPGFNNTHYRGSRWDTPAEYDKDAEKHEERARKIRNELDAAHNNTISDADILNLIRTNPNIKTIDQARQMLSKNNYDDKDLAAAEKEAKYYRKKASDKRRANRQIRRSGHNMPPAYKGDTFDANDNLDKKIDFKNYLTGDRSQKLQKENPYERDNGSPNVRKYRELARDVKRGQSDISWTSRQLGNVEADKAKAKAEYENKLKAIDKENEYSQRRYQDNVRYLAKAAQAKDDFMNAMRSKRSKN